MKYFKIIFLSVFLITTCFVLWKCTKDQPKEIKKPKILVQRDDLPTSDPCEDGSAGNCTGAYSLTTATISLSDYPGCTFRVTYKIRSCPVGKIDIIILYVNDFGDPSSADPDICPDFQAAIDALDAATYPVAFELFFDNFENKIGKALTIQLTASIAPPCGTAYPPITVSFISGHCNYSCYFKEYVGEGKTKSVYYTWSCGDVCCEQKYAVCTDNGMPVITKVGSTTPYGNCQPSNWPRPCPENTFYRSTCKEKCRFNF